MSETEGIVKSTIPDSPTEEEIQERIREYAEERDDLIGDIARRYVARQEESA